ncbi:hypothetical protein AB0387_08650 [Streptomyces sp. NPDC089173]|uniref:hypothetical protein n=1 Tax=Streptomyces sp. NPDC089173 TaxID=3154965 RepID=UPI003450C9A7
MGDGRAGRDARRAAGRGDDKPADHEPLAALRAVNIVQRLTRIYASCAALDVQRDSTLLAASGAALGCGTAEVESRLRKYTGRF